MRPIPVDVGSGLRRRACCGARSGSDSGRSRGRSRSRCIMRGECRDEAMYAMATRKVGMSRRVPQDALQGFGKVLVEKEKHQAVASEARLRSRVERSEMTRVRSNNAKIISGTNANTYSAPCGCFLVHVLEIILYFCNGTLPASTSPTKSYGCLATHISNWPGFTDALFLSQHPPRIITVRGRHISNPCTERHI